MNGVWLERSAIPLGIYFVARAVARYRGMRRQREGMATPLLDGALLEATLQPRPRDGDDADLLAEVRDTLAHLNRQAYAEEFWGLHAQLAALDANLGPPQKATLRRALVRLVTANDRWLQLIGAKTSADLGFKEAIPPIRALLEMGETLGFSASKAAYSPAEAVQLRFRRELEESLATLGASVTATESPAT